MELSFLHYVSLAFLRFCSFDGKPDVVNFFCFTLKEETSYKF